MKTILFIISLLMSSFSFSQTEGALVFFADKENVDASINNPISILTQDAIDRKNLHDTPIDARDVPVTEAYITTIKNADGITIHAKSKWLNAVYVRGIQSDIESLLDVDFVTSIEFSDKDLNTDSFNLILKDKFTIENQNSKTTYIYGDALNQTTQISADYLHEQGLTGTDMVVAVLDSGFPNIENNPAFSAVIMEGRLLGTYDFVLRQDDVTGIGSHGARTFSDIAAFVQDEFVGTAPTASYYLFRTEDTSSETPLEEAFWLEALERADSLGVDVVNTSLGYKNFDNPNYNHSYEDLDGQTTIGARAGNIAFEKGMLLVTSAGNSGNSNSPFVSTPADSPGILTVGAVNADGTYASFSSVGPTVDGRIKPDVMAQGSNAAVVDQFGTVTFSSGTSFSSPIMAGAITALWQDFQELTNAEIIQIVRESATLFDNPTDEMGYGIPNFEAAFFAAETLSQTDVFLQNQFALYPNPVGNQLHISFPEPTEQAKLSIYNMTGQQLFNRTISANQKTDVSGLASGLYLVRVDSEDSGLSNSFKIIKQ